MERPEALCRVCGDKASGKHYGVASCDGCRGFFKRSIRRYRNKTLDYVCKENGSCIVDVTRRNQCQACRFQKCLQVNMKKDAVQHERAPRSVQKRPLFGTDLSSVGSLTGNLLGSGVPSPMPALPPYYPGFFSPSAFKPGSLSPFLPPAPPLPPLTLTLSHNSAFRPSSTASVLTGGPKSPAVSSSSALLGHQASGEGVSPANSLAFLSSSVNTASFMSSLTPAIPSSTTLCSVPSSASFLQPYTACGPFPGGVGLLYSEPRLPSQSKLIITPPTTDLTPPTRHRNPASSGFAPPFTAESLAKPLRESQGERPPTGVPRPRPYEDNEPPLKRRRRSTSGGEEEVTSSGNPCPSPELKTSSASTLRATSSSSEASSVQGRVSPPSARASLFLSTFKLEMEALHGAEKKPNVEEDKEGHTKEDSSGKRQREDSTNNNYLPKAHQRGADRVSTEASPSDNISLHTYSPSPPPTPASSPSEKGSSLTTTERDVEGSPPRKNDSPTPSSDKHDVPRLLQEKSKISFSSSRKDDSPPPSEEKTAEGITIKAPESGPCEGIHESAARLLFLGVKWARSIPAFMQLSFRDQAILLEESWSELFLVSAAQWGLPLPDKDPPRPLQVAPPVEIGLMRELCGRFHSLNVDATEYACLKALILFRPEARGLRDGRGVEALQDQTQLMFHEYLASKVGGACARVRVGKLLLLLPPLSHVSASAIQDIFFKRTVGDIPIERVLCDMFKSC